MKRLISLGVSLLVDAVQIFLSPLLAIGVGEGLDAGIDVAMCLFLTWLRGFHWLYLPTFIAELIPGIDLVPFWTLAVALTWNLELRSEKSLGSAEKTVQPANPTANPEKSLPEPKL